MHKFITLGPKAKRNHLDVTFFVREKGRINLGVSAHAGAQSGDAVCICVYRKMPSYMAIGNLL